MNLGWFNFRPRISPTTNSSDLYPASHIDLQSSKNPCKTAQTFDARNDVHFVSTCTVIYSYVTSVFCSPIFIDLHFYSYNFPINKPHTRQLGCEKDSSTAGLHVSDRFDNLVQKGFLDDKLVWEIYTLVGHILWGIFLLLTIIIIRINFLWRKIGIKHKKLHHGTKYFFIIS